MVDNVLNIKTLASGSSGNAYHITCGKSSLLIEAGIPYRRIQQGVGFNMSGIDGVLLTHEHFDHSKAIPDILKAGINVYTSKGTADALGLDSYRVKTVEAYKPFTVGGLKVVAFDVKHDCAAPLGFVVKSLETSESLCFITDSYYVEAKFANISIFMVECNYITKKLMESDTHPDMVKRIMQSHMGLETCIQFLQAQGLSKCKKIYLVHLSAGHGDAEIMRREVMRATGCQVEVAGCEN